MEKESRYIEEKRYLKSISDNENISDKDRPYIHALLHLMDVDKSNKILDLAISNNNSIDSLLEKIYKTINQYNKKILYLKTDDNTSEEKDDLVSKVEQLKTLKKEVTEFIKSEIDEIYEDVDELFERICSKTSGEKHIISKLHAYIKDKYDENLLEGPISSNVATDMIDSINDPDFIEQLKVGKSILHEEEEKNELLNLCDSVLSTKDLVLENLEDIILANSLEEIINDKKKSASKDNTRRMDYEDTKRKYAEVSKKLNIKGLKGLLLNNSVKLSLALSKNDLLLPIQMSEIKSETDFDQFYLELAKIRDNVDAYMKGEFLDKKTDFVEDASEEVLEFVGNNKDLATSIIKLSETYKIDNKAIGLLALDVFLTLKTTPVEELDISAEKIEKAQKYFDEEVSKVCDNYSDIYLSIINGDEKSY